ncbi:nitronate monooxygenase [Ferrovibrio sp.]|uniref:NAD(P)H-dependent flavin oxidoreductase n=1 Tax=Ferrovibrio sp. TaxID=1917215 RepID=UPI000CB704A8|nr:nitronate monooxygenase [Ferrovibrio sp.]PJI40175.1 MAG: 2-nitropropane dioxygenase [Ferrovibrio sp.]
MTAWPDRRILDLFNIELPILQAPMAGASTPQMAIAVSEAGGLGSQPCAMLNLEQTRAALDLIRQATSKPLNVNFFVHQTPPADATEGRVWRDRLAPYYAEWGLTTEVPPPVAGRAPFDETFCQLMEEYRPEVVSFHFGMPEQTLLDRVKAFGAKVIASATTVEEAVWLEQRGCDAIIAMGLEAGGHRGNFLSMDMSQQVGLFALLPQVVDAVKVPVIAAGGISDARGIVAAMALGASAVQIGTAYLLSPEATITPWHRAALKNSPSDATALTNLFTGRPARGIMNRLMREQGPLSPDAPPFPTAGATLAPLRAKTEGTGNSDFSNMWSGQAVRLAQEMPAGELTRKLADEALAKLKRG